MIRSVSLFCLRNIYINFKIMYLELDLQVSHVFLWYMNYNLRKKPVISVRKVFRIARAVLSFQVWSQGRFNDLVVLLQCLRTHFRDIFGVPALSGAGEVSPWSCMLRVTKAQFSFLVLHSEFAPAPTPSACSCLF